MVREETDGSNSSWAHNSDVGIMLQRDEGEGDHGSVGKVRGAKASEHRRGRTRHRAYTTSSWCYVGEPAVQSPFGGR